MKVFISADIEGVNGIVNWDETDMEKSAYATFREEMTAEVRAACLGANAAGVDTILVKDAHDSARNLIHSQLPENVLLHRGWQGVPCSMMAGLDESFDGVIFIGYHSGASSNGNPLSHTMNTQNVYVKINGVLASEFYINALYAAYLGVPVLFLSGDEALCEEAQAYNPGIEVVATKKGVGGAVISPNPAVTLKQIEEGVEKVFMNSAKPKVIPLPKEFTVEIKYKRVSYANSVSFYPGCKLIASDTVEFKANDYYEVLRALKFIL